MSENISLDSKGIYSFLSIANRFIFRLFLMTFSWELPPLIKKFAVAIAEGRMYIV